jgi:hypothetical protein
MNGSLIYFSGILTLHKRTQVFAWSSPRPRAPDLNLSPSRARYFWLQTSCSGYRHPLAPIPQYSRYGGALIIGANRAGGWLPAQTARWSTHFFWLLLVTLLGCNENERIQFSQASEKKKADSSLATLQPIVSWQKSKKCVSVQWIEFTAPERPI